MTVSAVVVTWNSAGVIEDLLASLGPAFAGVGWRLTVVDNASSDDTVALVEHWLREHDDVAGTVLQTGRNAGYAAAVNAALDHDEQTAVPLATPASTAAPAPAAIPAADAAPGAAPVPASAPAPDATLILNPDIRLAPGCVRAMLDALQKPARPPTGIVVPRILDADGRLYRSLRRAPSLSRAMGEALLGRHSGRFGRLGETVGDEAAYRAATTADWATGAVMLISRDCLEACGRWDESFFLYSEETEYALRAGDHGFATRLAPEAEVTHLGGESKTSGRLWALLTVNRVRLYRKRHGRTMTALFWGAVLLREVPRAALGRAPSRSAVAALLRLRPVAR